MDANAPRGGKPSRDQGRDRQEDFRDGDRGETDRRTSADLALAAIRPISEPFWWEIEEEAARTRATKALRPVEVLTFDLG